MSRPRTAAVLGLLAAVALSTTACTAAAKASSKVDDTAADIAVCSVAMKKTNDTVDAVDKETDAFNKTAATEADNAKYLAKLKVHFADLHTTLAAQAPRTKGAKLKTSIQNLDALAAGYGTKPQPLDAAAGAKLNTLTSAVASACNG